MTLHLPDRWVWDFWFAHEGIDRHCFYLQADRSLGDPELRHWNVSIGHAVSRDLVTWEILPDALAPADGEAWDDFVTWTGSVIRHDGRWHLLYTGASHREDGLVQRIGLATSDDLVHWQRHPANPVLELDPRWYEQLDVGVWHDQAWRDPWVFHHPDSGDFHALVTARVRSGAPDERGVIGHARSDDLIHWDVLPPLTEPGDFGQLEVPQLVGLAGRWYLLFSSETTTHSKRRRDRTGRSGISATYALVGDAPLGPFHALTDEPLVESTDTLYSGKIVDGPSGAPVFLAVRGDGPGGRFAGELIDPLPVAVGDDHRLQIG